MPEVEIQFGTMFRVAGQRERVDVVIDPGNDNLFEAHTLHEKDGQTWLSIIGGTTVGLKDISDIIGKMSREEVVNAMEIGANKDGIIFDGRWRELFLINADKPPRKISI